MQNSGFTAEQPKKKKSVQIQSLIINLKKKKREIDEGSAAYSF